MAEEQEGRKSKVPFVCGMGCLICITALLMTTEWLTDASVMLLRVRLCLLCICILPFAMMGIGNGSVAKIVSIASFVCILVVCVTMFYDRNRVVRIYIADESIDEAQTKHIEGLLERPIVLLIAGKAKGLPESLEKYNKLNMEFYKQVSGRMKPDEIPKDDLPKEDLNTDRLRSARYSGISERTILLVPSELINEKNYAAESYTEVKKDQ